MAASTLLIFLLALPVVHPSTAVPFVLNIHHRFSDKLRRWTEAKSPGLTEGWPEIGTTEYYSALASQDHYLLRRRGLLDSSPHLTFSEGNKTSSHPSLGFLHYAEVEIGTPKVSFLVALDTGSHLFWVPCDCEGCVPDSNDQASV